MRFVRKVGKLLLFCIAGIILVVVLSNIWVVTSTDDKVFADYHSLPDSAVALVLGTSSRLTNGSPNIYFRNRIKMAAALYKQGKVTHFLLSGDNRSSKYYNEPLEMRKALVGEGVPDSVITLDYAGLRTLDSIVRSKEIFGQDRITIITQPFHCYRAIFISQFYDIDAVAIQAEPDTEVSAKVYLREYFARTKAVIDLYILRTAPVHLGQKEPLDI